MATSQDKAQELCSKTEWDTIVNSFPPKVGELPPAVLKKHANRVRRFLDKEKSAPQAEGRLALFEEALARLDAARAPEGAAEGPESDEKLAARREKEKAARDREKAIRDKRQEVKVKLKEKADKEKAEKEGESKDDKDKKSNSKGVRGHLQAAAKRSQGKIGSRKV